MYNGQTVPLGRRQILVHKDGLPTNRQLLACCGQLFPSGRLLAQNRLFRFPQRRFRELRRRTRPMSSFTIPASCDRIIFGVISHLNHSWERTPPKEFAQNATRRW